MFLIINHIIWDKVYNFITNIIRSTLHKLRIFTYFITSLFLNVSTSNFIFVCLIITHITLAGLFSESLFSRKYYFTLPFSFLIAFSSNSNIIIIWQGL
jgi:hypothetical protein